MIKEEGPIKKFESMKDPKNIENFTKIIKNIALAANYAAHAKTWILL